MSIFYIHTGHDFLLEAWLAGFHSSLLSIHGSALSWLYLLYLILPMLLCRIWFSVFFWLILLIYNSPQACPCRVRASRGGGGCKPCRWWCSPLNIMDSANAHPLFKPQVHSWMLHEVSASSHIWTGHRFGRQKCSPAGDPKAALENDAFISWLLADELSFRVGGSFTYREETSKAMGQEGEIQTMKRMQGALFQKCSCRCSLPAQWASKHAPYASIKSQIWLVPLPQIPKGQSRKPKWFWAMEFSLLKHAGEIQALTWTLLLCQRPKTSRRNVLRVLGYWRISEMDIYMS